VEGYYDDGMRVPDYVTLLWADDLLGNVRRYPLVSERNRTGGAGVYYHVCLFYSCVSLYEVMNSDSLTWWEVRDPTSGSL